MVGLGTYGISPGTKEVYRIGIGPMIAVEGRGRRKRSVDDPSSCLGIGPTMAISRRRDSP